MTTTQTETETRTNRYGFPLVDCYRCGGSGHYSYTPSYGTTCFGCSGSGVAVKRGKAAKAYQAFMDAMPKKETTPEHLRVGVDKVAHNGKWVLVTGKTVSPSINGWSLTDGVKVPTAWRMTITLETGEVLSSGTSSLHRRKVTADMMPNPRDYWPAS